MRYISQTWPLVLTAASLLVIGAGACSETTPVDPPDGTHAGDASDGGGADDSGGNSNGSGAGGTGGSAAGGSETNGTAYQFFVIGDPRSNWGIFEDNVRSMWALDPSAVAVFSTGDLTPTGASDEWDDHQDALANGAPDNTVAQDPLGIVRQSRIRTDVSGFGDYARYVGVLGNHDDGVSGWLDNWNDYLPGQASLGENSTEGVYFSLTYESSLFIVLDSIHTSSEQTSWLEQLLSSSEASSATWKLAFFHDPVYPCNKKSEQDDVLEWVELFEQYGVDIAFVADSHTYERSCPMVGGSCASEGGVIHLNTSGAGAGTRDVYPDKTGTVSNDNRADDYDCAEILAAYKGNWHHFTHVAVEGCKLTMNAYSHDNHATLEPAFDTLVLDKCAP